MIPRAILAGVLLASPGQGQVAPLAPAPAPEPIRFVVLGHVRGDGNRLLNPRFIELLERVKALEPDLIVLTGDIIWGDVQTPNPDPLSIVHQWEAVDSALDLLGVPVLRVPGNHDISDVVSRDIYIERYGRPPSVVRVAGHRFILLSSAWIPADGDTLKNPFVGGHDLDSAQVGFLRSELTGHEEPGRVFVFMHHLLWWEQPSGPSRPDKPRGAWWSEVHPILVQGDVDAVFTGDYGPLKFSHTRRDGVEYYQASIETQVSLEMLRARPSSRILSSQFDNFLEVTVTDSAADVRVHTVAEVSSGEFTPARYAAISAPSPGDPDPLLQRAWRFVGTPKRVIALGMLAIVFFVGGYLLGRRRLATR